MRDWCCNLGMRSDPNLQEQDGITPPPFPKPLHLMVFCACRTCPRTMNIGSFPGRGCSNQGHRYKQTYSPCHSSQVLLSDEGKSHTMVLFYKALCCGDRVLTSHASYPRLCGATIRCDAWPRKTSPQMDIFKMLRPPSYHLRFLLRAIDLVLSTPWSGRKCSPPPCSNEQDVHALSTPHLSRRQGQGPDLSLNGP